MQKVLWIESGVNAHFIQSLLKLLNLKANIKVEPKINTEKNHQALKSIEIIKELNDGNIQQLAIIADADSFEQNAGFNDSRQILISYLNPILQELGIAEFPLTINPENLGKGEIVKNQEISVGLWIMPNHQNDGYLETFILNNINLNQNLNNSFMQSDLKNYATDCLTQLKAEEMQLFKTHHQDKANLYTWLAWQKNPTQFLHNAIDAELLEINSTNIQNFKQWLFDCFN